MEKEEVNKDNKTIGRVIVFIIIALLVFSLAITLLNYLCNQRIITFMDDFTEVLNKIKSLLWAFGLCLTIIGVIISLLYIVHKPSTGIKKAILRVLLKSTKIEIASDLFSIVWEKEELREVASEYIEEVSSVHLKADIINKLVKSVDDSFGETDKRDVLSYVRAVIVPCLQIAYPGDTMDVKVLDKRAYYPMYEEYKIPFMDQIIFIYIPDKVNSYIIKDVIWTLNDLMVILNE